MGDMRWQMNCCLCCGGPTEPSREAMRRDKVVARSMNFIEGEAIKNAALWNLPKNVEPTLISEKQNLHLFHQSNILDIVQSFYDGKVANVWLNDNTPGYVLADFPIVRPTSTRGRKLCLNAWGKRKADIDPTDFVVGAAKEFRAVYWAAPAPLPGFNVLADLVETCITNSGKFHIPRTNEMVPGCKMCNDIMTQQGTSSHFLVRTSISNRPLVPTQSVLTYTLTGKGGTYSADKGTPFRYDPGEDNMNQRAAAFNYQGCMAYYIHRCLPRRPAASVILVDRERKVNVRKIMAAFSFLILEIACLTFERYNGSDGATKMNPKPAFRYRGCTEVYLSYIFWVILSNDIPEGEDPGVPFAMLDFCQFHRYFLSEVVDTLVISNPEFADAYELGDVVFGDNEVYTGNSENITMMPGSAWHPPDEILEFICKRICTFYRDTLKPTFSRHMANLNPNPNLLMPTHADFNEALHIRQMLVCNMLISVSVLHSMTHLLEKTTIGDIDTFVESVGAHGVFWLWQRMLNMGPLSMERLMGNFMDSLTLIEYKNIRTSLSADPSKPAITEEDAESMYVMCNCLDLRAEPRNERELWDLKQGNMCSPPKSIARLNRLGAFRSDD